MSYDCSCRIFNGSHSWPLDPPFQSIPDHRKLISHERLQAGTRAAFQEKNTGRSSVIDQWKKTVPRCFSAEAGEKQHFWTGVDNYNVTTLKTAFNLVRCEYLVQSLDHWSSPISNACSDIWIFRRTEKWRLCKDLICKWYPPQIVIILRYWIVKKHLQYNVFAQSCALSLYWRLRNIECPLQRERSPHRFFVQNLFLYAANKGTKIGSRIR